MWHIAKRELYDNLNSLRFALATVLILGLMLTNAVVHLREYPERIQKYSEDVAAHQNRLKSYAEESLYRLAQKGPGDLYKKPSSLHFCAARSEAFLAAHVNGNAHAWSWDDRGLVNFWALGYPSVTPNRDNLDPEVTKVDWGFIIGYVLSLLALLFTFDSISNEREHGTLRLVLANAIPRHTVLIGKFLGALVSVSIPFTLAVLVNLLVISMSSDVYLSADAWGRLGIIYFIALLYTCLFLALGLLVSARVQRSAVSLVILLLAWVTLVVFMPSTLASIAGHSSSEGRSSSLRTGLGFWERREEYDTRWHEAREDERKKLQLSGEYVTQDAEQRERSHAEHLKRRISQVNRARTITRLSPVTIVEHLLESFAGTGFERHLQFLENVQSYARQFRQFIVDTDRADPESLHIIGVREGVSQQPVNPEAVPKFEDTRNFGRDFNTAAMDLLLLTLFFVIFFSGAFLAFVRVEI